MRQAAAVLDAHGAPLSLEAVETVLGRLMPHRFLLRWETAHAWRTTLVRLGDDGVLTLDRTTPDLVAMRRAIRKLARTTIVQRTRDEHFARVHAQSMTILAKERRRDAEAAARLRRAVLRVVPEPGAPLAVALLDVAARTVRTFVGAEIVHDLSGGLGDFDLLAGLHIRETLAALGLDAESWRLVHLRPPRRTRRLNRRGRTLALTAELLIAGTVQVSRPLGDPAVMAAYLASGTIGRLRRRLESDVKPRPAGEGRGPAPVACAWSMRSRGRRSW